MSPASRQFQSSGPRPAPFCIYSGSRSCAAQDALEAERRQVMKTLSKQVSFEIEQAFRCWPRRQCGRLCNIAAATTPHESQGSAGQRGDPGGGALILSGAARATVDYILHLSVDY